MKYFTIQKIGYTAGIYECSNEYFSLVITNTEVDTDKYIHSIYGKLTKKDIPTKLVESEYTLARTLKECYLPTLSTYDGTAI